jgi:hypothetical protein
LSSGDVKRSWRRKEDGGGEKKRRGGLAEEGRWESIEVGSA